MSHGILLRREELLYYNDGGRLIQTGRDDGTNTFFCQNGQRDHLFLPRYATTRTFIVCQGNHKIIYWTLQQETLEYDNQGRFP